MATDLKPETSFLEAPASWNTRYINPQGFVCQITLRGETGKDLLEKASVAISFLLEQGNHPCENNNHNGKETKLCPIHHCEMKQREKDGKKCFSHKAEDGSWCYGKERKQNGGSHDQIAGRVREQQKD